MASFKVYSASAGSGKTYTLTKEYLKLALFAPAEVRAFADAGEPYTFNPRYFRHILAVTFTIKATNEMKGRILEVLNTLKHADLQDNYLKELQESGTKEWNIHLTIPELIERAGLVHTALLHHYSDFSISTLDSFAARVVQTFSLDFGLPQQYDIELDPMPLIQEGVHQLLQELVAEGNSPVQQIVEHYAMDDLQGENWFIDFKILQTARNLFKENAERLMQLLQNTKPEEFLKATQALRRDLSQLLQSIQSIGKEALALIERNQFEDGDFKGKSKGVHKFFKKLTEVKGPKDLFGSNGALLKIPKTHTKNYENGTFLNADTNPVNASLLEFYKQYLEIAEDDIAGHICTFQMYKFVHRLALMGTLLKKVQKLSNEKGRVILQSFNKQINKIIQQEPVPYIYERLGERYHHLLIDEFQDTSSLQWQNLIPLLSNSLSYENMNLVVGDTKQSIYRWRGGDPSLLNALPKVETDPSSNTFFHAENFPQHFKKESLEKNWRSHENIIHFNNSLFQFLKTYAKDNVGERVGEFYADVEQATNHRAGGSVEVYQSEKLQDEIKRQIELALEEGYRYGDIAILCRTNGKANEIAEKLLLEGVPVVSEEALLLKSSPYVRFIIQFFRFLAVPQEARARMEILLFLREHLSAQGDTLAGEELLKIKEVCDNAEVKMHDFITYLNEKFNISLTPTELMRLTLFEKAEYLIALFRLNDDPKQQIYLQSFLDLLLDEGHRLRHNLLDFIEFWTYKEGSLRVTPLASQNAVSILSIHKSKGLEFPVVLFPYADWSLTFRGDYDFPTHMQEEEAFSGFTHLPFAVFDNSPASEVIIPQKVQREKEAYQLENLNLLYVACTRAVAKLWIGISQDSLSKSSAKNKVRKQSYASDYFLAFMEEETGQSAENTESWQPYAETPPAQPAPQPPAQESITMRSAKFRQQISFRRSVARAGERKIDLANWYPNRELGLLIHYTLELIHTEKDLPTALAAIQLENLASAEEAEIIGEKLEEVFAFPILQEFFADHTPWEVLNEQEILLHTPTAKNERIARPDRLLLQRSTKQAVVLDYKTGKQLKSHQAQIADYKKLLLAMGFSEVRALLVYLEPLAVVEV